MSADKLTDEQIARIAHNKAAALARRASALYQKSAAPVSPAVNHENTDQILQSSAAHHGETLDLVDSCWRAALLASSSSISSETAVDPARVQYLNSNIVNRKGSYVLWWVQSDVREAANHALEYAVAAANGLGVPVLACYGLFEKFPGANARSFSFLIDGLADLSATLEHERGIALVVVRAPAPEAVELFAPRACLVVTDRAYARPCVAWRRAVAAASPCRVVQVETGVVVPVELASCQAELSAGALRPKIKRLLPRFLKPLPRLIPNVSSSVRRNLTTSSSNTSSSSSSSNTSSSSSSIPLHPSTTTSIGGTSSGTSSSSSKDTSIYSQRSNATYQPVGALVNEIDVTDFGKLWSLCEPEAERELFESLDINRSIPPVVGFVGGTTAALERLRTFLSTQPLLETCGARGPDTGRLSNYANGAINDPGRPSTSMLSPYLHFGHISPVHVALAVKKQEQLSTKGGGGKVALPRSSSSSLPLSPPLASSLSHHSESSTEKRTVSSAWSASQGASSAEAFLEELVVRRELARNFVHFKPDVYDTYDVVPEWAKRTLEAHTDDPRTQGAAADVGFEELKRGTTDDVLWNAAQWEMVATGHMHNHMRMFWCKRIIEWAPSPATAFKWAITLNDTFELDGRDENGFMGVAWCFGHHDRAFPERPVFGTVRSMTAKGLEGKCDVFRYRELVRAKVLKALSEAREKNSSELSDDCDGLDKDIGRLAKLLPLEASAPITGKRPQNSQPLSLGEDIRGFFGKSGSNGGSGGDGSSVSPLQFYNQIGSSHGTKGATPKEDSHKKAKKGGIRGYFGSASGDKI